MSELFTFVRLGFHHITDPEALDHVLFLLALAAIYRGRDWRDSLWVISAFTVGHSITLALAVTGALRLPTPLIEFLIPVTIVVTGIENIAVRRRERAPLRGRYRPVFAGAIAVPLFGFNVGIELGQLVVLAVAGVVLAALDRLLAWARGTDGMLAAFRLRVVAVSGAVVLVAARMAAMRAPW